MPRPPKPLAPDRSPATWFGAEVRHWRRHRAYSQRELGELVHVHADTIAKIEKAQRGCSRELAAALDRTLATGGVLERAWPLVDTHRTAPPPRPAPAAPSAGLLPHRPAEPPREVHPADIAQIREAARTFASWDHSYGGSVARIALTAHLEWSGRLLHARIPASLRRDAFTAVAHLACVGGFTAFDAYAHDDARRMFAFALETAEEAGDWHLRAKVLSNRARQAVWCARPDEGLTWAELGLVRAERLSPPEQAMLHTARARAHARMGDRAQALAAVDAADRAFSSPADRPAPAWMDYYDAAQHAGDTGHALWDLAVAGTHPPGEALRRLQTATEGHTGAYARSRAISGIKLASLQMRATDPQQAVETAMRALDDAGRVRSRRAEDDLRELYRTAAHHRRCGSVTDLRDRIIDLVGDP
ncbi:helix-turn-helix domain-containing protein [Nocardiopsis trehalosi]|uniref:helix-turn-helix domain-containing protein n=1 Tax=Nocardiopsis trehalosi TaxID=109329 RepID=UPI000B2D981A|nr:helix-turn-helix transcriptional regulator [Nocardiopsis trehalosi]